MRKFVLKNHLIKEERNENVKKIFCRTGRKGEKGGFPWKKMLKKSASRCCKNETNGKMLQKRNDIPGVKGHFAQENGLA